MNLFRDLAPPAAAEEFATLLTSGDVRIERIVSHGHASPCDFWYDQPQAEWVAVLQGQAELQFEDRPDLILLVAGDTLFIPAHQRHRVASTAANEPTIWLAVHFPSETTHAS